MLQSFAVQRVLALAVLSLALSGCCGPCFAPCIPGVWPKPAPEAEALVILSDEQYDGHYSITNRRLRLELRRGKEVLHRVETPLAIGEMACLSTARRDGQPGDYFALFREDPPAHAHPLVRAWSFDLAARKIVPADPTGLRCPILCPDEEP